MRWSFCSPRMRRGLIIEDLYFKVERESDQMGVQLNLTYQARAHRFRRMWRVPREEWHPYSWDRDEIVWDEEARSWPVEPVQRFPHDKVFLGFDSSPESSPLLVHLEVAHIEEGYTRLLAAVDDMPNSRGDKFGVRVWRSGIMGTIAALNREGEDL